MQAVDKAIASQGAHARARSHEPVDLAPIEAFGSLISNLLLRLPGIAI